MFRAGQPFGVDLAALNIQRGRDHGLRPYNDYRVLVGLTRITAFEEFGGEVNFGSKINGILFLLIKYYRFFAVGREVIQSLCNC